MNVKEIIISSNKIVLDTGVLIEYFKADQNKIKHILRETLFNENSNTKIYMNYIIKSEIYYILCRALGKQKAIELLDEIESFFLFEESKKIYELAGQIKCKFPISLADCYSIATGLVQDCPIFFMKEEELSENMVRRINHEFKAKIYIIDKNKLES